MYCRSRGSAVRASSSACTHRTASARPASRSAACTTGRPGRVSVWMIVRFLSESSQTRKRAYTRGPANRTETIFMFGRRFTTAHLRLDDRRQQRPGRAAPLRVRRRHDDIHPEADVGLPDAVRLAGGAVDVEALERAGVAAPPLVGVRRRVVRPRAGIGRELLADRRVTGDRRPRGVPRRGGRARLHERGLRRAGVGGAVGVHRGDAHTHRVVGVAAATRVYVFCVAPAIGRAAVAVPVAPQPAVLVCGRAVLPGAVVGGQRLADRGGAGDRRRRRVDRGHLRHRRRGAVARDAAAIAAASARQAPRSSFCVVRFM